MPYIYIIKGSKLYNNKKVTKMATYFLIDGTNNNKVVNEFSTLDHVEQYLNAKEHTENWEGYYDTFEDYKGEFFTVTSDEMKEAVHKFGMRRKKYWT